MFKRLNKKWAELFSFVHGIDITDDTQVLFRKNVVIKNIIFLTNLAYTVILLIVSLTESSTSNYVFLLIISILTYMVNKALKSIIHSNKDDFVKQEVAMYVAVIYIFISAAAIYIKLKIGSPELAESGYVLLFYALVVCSLYQDVKLLKNMFVYIFLFFTVVHFTLTYDIYNQIYVKDLSQFINALFTQIEFKDIFLRTIILIIFMIVIYSISEIAQYMQTKRKEELIKRREVQNDFANIVSNLFNSIFANKQSEEESRRYVDLVEAMSKKLAGLVGLSPEICIKIGEFSRYHIDHRAKLDELTNCQSDSFNEKEFELLRENTSIGSKVVKRMQLAQKCENIVRAHTEAYVTHEFEENMNKIQYNTESNIILMCEMYITLRSNCSYKRPHTHQNAMNALQTEFKKYIEELVFDRFIKYNVDFENMFNNY